MPRALPIRSCPAATILAAAGARADTLSFVNGPGSPGDATCTAGVGRQRERRFAAAGQSPAAPKRWAVFADAAL